MGKDSIRGAQRAGTKGGERSGKIPSPFNLTNWGGTRMRKVGAVRRSGTPEILEKGF